MKRDRKISMDGQAEGGSMGVANENAASKTPSADNASSRDESVEEVIHFNDEEPAKATELDLVTYKFYKKKKRTGGKALRIIFTALVLLAVAFSCLLACTLRWAFAFWADLTMDEIVYHLTSPLEGTSDDIMMRFYTSALLPAVLILAVVIILLVMISRKKKEWYGKFLAGAFVLSLVVAGTAFYDAWVNLKIGDYLKNQEITSSFIEDNYVDPNSVALTFPKTKRNLIFIYLESVEMTFADKENGGGFAFNCIPELTKLAQKYEDFSGTSDKLNGGHVEPGTTFTMGGMFGMTSGLPLQVGLKAQIMDKRGAMNEMYTQEHFFPGITTLGDILADAGYHNVLFIGSDAKFGGRKLYFTEHGDYEIDDFAYAVNRNWLTDKENSWGYSDWRLFLQAKERLKELTAEDKPFNLTLLTVDTHFEDGIRCQYCKYEYPGNGYADVYSCSSRQIDEFVSWCQEQDWYDDTTIVLSGDHLTMDSDFCKLVDGNYPRKTYTCYINADTELSDAERKRDYTTLDNFPTTLAAMGVKIEGERLGLGTNLFSAEDTLYEKYGDEMDAELARRSLFMEQVSEFDPETQAYKNAIIMYEAARKDESKTDSSGDGSSVTDSSKADGSAGDSSVTDGSVADNSAADNSAADSSVADSSASDSFAADSSGMDESATDSDKSAAEAALANSDASSLTPTVSPSLAADVSDETGSMLENRSGSSENLPGAESLLGEALEGADESVSGTENLPESASTDGDLWMNLPGLHAEGPVNGPLVHSEAVFGAYPLTNFLSREKRDGDASALGDFSMADDWEEEDDNSQNGADMSEQADASGSNADYTKQNAASRIEADTSGQTDLSAEDASVGDGAESETDDVQVELGSDSRISGNPLEVGPGATQMYPNLLRKPDYGLYAESKLRTDPYAALSGNRQSKAEPKISNPESTDQLRSFIENWKGQS
ncbi:MAG: sulfatase-like hydrolase/transferase [Lachnospiraceae bacterium]|nr:sulfatase-like hydrolase/transferase [Lachnospiraceae bacterium]